MGSDRSEILQGTLDLMVLKTLDSMGPLHGYGIARRIEQISEEALQINQGTLWMTYADISANVLKCARKPLAPPVAVSQKR